VHQESVAVSYTRMAATQLLATGLRGEGSDKVHEALGEFVDGLR